MVFPSPPLSSPVNWSIVYKAYQTQTVLKVHYIVLLTENATGLDSQSSVQFANNSNKSEIWYSSIDQKPNLLAAPMPLFSLLTTLLHSASLCLLPTKLSVLNHTAHQHGALTSIFVFGQFM